MATADHARHQLYQRLTETIGPEEATTLMELLPQPGEPEPASKADLERLAARMDERFLGVDARFSSVDARFDQMDQRFISVDAHFDQIDQRFDQVTELVDLRIDTCESRLRGEIRALGAISGIASAEMRTELGTDRAELRTELSTSLAEMRTELGTGLAEVGTALADLRTELHRSLRINLLVTVGFLGTLISLVALITTPT